MPHLLIPPPLRLRGPGAPQAEKCGPNLTPSLGSLALSGLALRTSTAMKALRGARTTGGKSMRALAFRAHTVLDAHSLAVPH